MFGKETYLGDGVFVSFDGQQIDLRAERWNEEDHVYLDPSTLAAFLKYIEQIKEKQNARKEDPQT